MLDHWGVRSTDDIGRIVFVLIDIGLLTPDGSDRVEDFDSVFDFEEAFEDGYPWAGIGRTGGSV